MSSPPVTFALPVKNGMPFIRETLQSIAEQNYPNYSLLVWDNGSDDGTVEEVQRWIPDRIRGTCITAEPLPFEASLRSLVESADSEYIARIDADDNNYPQRLSRQVEFLEANQDFAAVGAQVRMIGEDGRPLDFEYPLPTEYHEVLAMMILQCPLHHPVVTFRKSKVLEVGNYRDLKPMEDYDLWLRLSAEYKLTNLPDTLLDYRVRENSITRQAKVHTPYIENRFEFLASMGEPYFAITEEKLLKLFHKKAIPSFPYLIKYANHIHKRTGEPLRRILSNPSFLFHARSLTHPNDLFSRAVWFFFDAGNKTTETNE